VSDPTPSTTAPVTPENLAVTLAAEAAQIGLDLPAATLTRLAAYASRLWAWNERLNLTRHTDACRFLQRDVADANALQVHLTAGERILDVGTGGGVPGVLLAILRPDLTVELSDSVGKRARAVAPLTKLLTWFEPLVDSYGRLLLIKGPRWEAEKADARHRGLLKQVTARRLAAWPIPGGETESVLLEVCRR